MAGVACSTGAQAANRSERHQGKENDRFHGGLHVWRNPDPKGCGKPLGSEGSIEIVRRQGCHLAFAHRLLVVGLKRSRAAEPGQDVVSFQAGGRLGKEGVVRGVGPVAQVVHKPVFLWVLMDVGDQADQMGIRGDRDAAERVLEEAAGALVCLVDRFGVGVEEVSELLTRV